MSSAQQTSGTGIEASGAGSVPMRFEVAVLPVTDVDRAKAFYEGLGWRLDADITIDEHYRVVQVTPPASPASIIFGAGTTTMAPGTVQDLMLIVEDIAAARENLVANGADVSEIWHERTGTFHHAGAEGRLAGPDPEGRSYRSWASFNDPDGNGWRLQEIKERLPGRCG